MAWLTVMKPPGSPPKGPRPNTLEAWKQRQQDGAFGAVDLEADDAQPEEPVEDPLALCARLLPELSRVTPAPPAAGRIEALGLLATTLDRAPTALAERIAQVARWEIEMIQKGRSERAMLGLRTMLPTLIQQFIQSRGR